MRFKVVPQPVCRLVNLSHVLKSSPPSLHSIRRGFFAAALFYFYFSFQAFKFCNSAMQLFFFHIAGDRRPWKSIPSRKQHRVDKRKPTGCLGFGTNLRTHANRHVSRSKPEGIL
jgi:hypothetical protein